MDNRIHIINNPLAQHYLSTLRDRRTPSHVFREVLEKIGFILGYEIAYELEWREYIVETPLAKTTGYKPSGKTLIVGILGASIPLIYGLWRAIPWAGLGLIAARRIEDDKGVRTVVYYERLPLNLRDYIVILSDPMLATGKTLEASIIHLRERNAGKIFIATVISSRYGVDYILGKFSNVKIYTLSVDPLLNKNYFIVPGLGDAGDRGLGVELFI